MPSSSMVFKQTKRSVELYASRTSQVLDLQDKHNASFNMYGQAETNPMAKIEKRNLLQAV